MEVFLSHSFGRSSNLSHPGAKMDGGIAPGSGVVHDHRLQLLQTARYIQQPEYAARLAIGVILLQNRQKIKVGPFCGTSLFFS